MTQTGQQCGLNGRSRAYCRPPQLITCHHIGSAVPALYYLSSDQVHTWYLSFCWHQHHFQLKPKTHQIQIFWHQKDTKLQIFTPKHTNLQYFNTRLEFSTPAPHVVHVTNIRYGSKYISVPSTYIRRHQKVSHSWIQVKGYLCLGLWFYLALLWLRFWHKSLQKLTQIFADADTNLCRCRHKSQQMQTQISTDSDTNHTSSFSAVSQYSKTCLYVPSHDHDHFCQSSEKSSGRNPQVHDYAKTQKSRLEVLGIN